jgi:hypothetical protein
MSEVNEIYVNMQHEVGGEEMTLVLFDYGTVWVPGNAGDEDYLFSVDYSQPQPPTITKADEDTTTRRQLTFT